IRSEFGEDAPAEVLVWLKARFDLDIAHLEHELSARSFLLGDAITVADLSCRAYLFPAHEAHIDLSPFRRVQMWLERIRSTDGFAVIADLLRKPSAGSAGGDKLIA